MTRANVETVNGFLSELGGKIGIQNLSLSDQGTCSFSFEDEIGLVIEAQSHSDEVHLYGELMTVPASGSEDVLLQLLQANLDLRQTQGATFALDSQKNTIVLYFDTQLDGLDQTQFEAVIENFLDVCAAWHQKLTAANAAQTTVEIELPSEVPNSPVFFG